MNYDTILPPRIYAELRRNPKTKRLKLWHLIALCSLLLIGLRHFNTVPHREWKTRYTDETLTHAFTSNYEDMVYTAEELFGSSYRGAIKGKDIGVSSKEFDDLLRLMPRYHRK